MRKNILITGQPKSGKSTVLDELTSSTPQRIGFLTKEIRVNGARTGFQVETSFGTKTLFASVSSESPHKVGKYFVHVGKLESLIPEVSSFAPDDLLYIDEIGQMQLLSEDFKNLVLKYLDSQNIAVATVSAVFEDDFIQAIKEREDIILIELTEDTREAKTEFLKLLLKKIAKAKKYAQEPERITRKGTEIEFRSEHGTRNLILENEKWGCDCDFFQENNICSHSIAVEEMTK